MYINFRKYVHKWKTFLLMQSGFKYMFLVFSMFFLHFSEPIRNIFKLCWSATLRNCRHGNRFVVCITCCHNGGSQLWTKTAWEKYQRGIWKYVKSFIFHIKRNWVTHMTFYKISLEIINSNYFSCYPDYLFNYFLVRGILLWKILILFQCYMVEK